MSKVVFSIISGKDMVLPIGIWEIPYYVGCLVVLIIAWKACACKSQLLSKKTI